MMLSKRSQWLTYACAFLYGVLGIGLFFAPETMSGVFAWNVTPFMTMTIGGWCLGTAWSALNTARNWQWRDIYCSIVYLWMFGIFQTLVLLVFSDKLRLGHPIAWLYVLALSVTVITAILQMIDVFQQRPPAMTADDPIFGVGMRSLVMLFVAIVLFLGIYGLTVPMGQRGTNGEIFPEVMSAFTLRSFGAFYLSIGISAIPLLITRSHRALLHHGLASYGLIIIITLAAVAYAGLFDFQERPYGLIYWVAYIGVGIVVGILLFINRKQLKVW